MTINVAQQYAIVLYPGNGSFGMVASVTLDGNGNVIGGEADGSANGFYWNAPSITGTYTLDATGHGNISLSLAKHHLLRHPATDPRHHGHVEFPPGNRRRRSV